jgi:peptide-methionine (S)-S-oxide reductase
MSDKQIATLAGGCFWCLEAVYEHMSGVEKVVSGYIAGDKPNPSYEEVCSGNSGHAEAVKITFDPALVTYAELLSVFFTIHDPTTLNRQGNDKGTQYRSAIYYHNEDQRAGSLVTELVAATTFYHAEDYHQHYYANHPEQGYCQFVVAPKLAKFKEHFAARMK